METMKFYLNCRANLNLVRKKHGLMPLIHDKKLRECLRCERHFTSIGSMNRICDFCSNNREDYALFVSGNKRKARGGKNT